MPACHDLKTSTEESVLRLLSEFEPLTHRDLQKLVGCTQKAAFERMRRLWDRKLIHIVGHERQAQSIPLPLYAIGSLPDAPRPPRIPLGERVAKYQKTAKGIAALKRSRKLAVAKKRKLRESDPAYAEKLRIKAMVLESKKGKKKVTAPLVRVDRIDPLLAVMMGFGRKP